MGKVLRGNSFSAGFIKDINLLGCNLLVMKIM